MATTRCGSPKRARPKRLAIFSHWEKIAHNRELAREGFLVFASCHGARTPSQECPRSAVEYGKSMPASFFERWSRVLGFERGRDGLTALISRRRPGSSLRPSDSRPLGELFELAALPLSALPPAQQPRRLLEAWSRLNSVREMDAQVLSAVLVVLTETVPGEPGAARLADLSAWGTAPPRPVATAAHPRAFQGTKRRLPKAAASVQLDLRPYLGEPRTALALLRKAAPLWQESVALLPEDLRSLVPLQPQSDGLSPLAGFASLPILFRRWLLPSVRGLGWPEIERLKSAYHELELDRNPHLLAALARLAATCPRERLSDWTRLVALQSPDRRAGFVVAVLQGDGARASPRELIDVGLGTLEHLVPAESYESTVGALAANLSFGASARNLMDGLQLARKFEDTLPRLRGPVVSSDFPRPAVEALLDHIAPSPSWRSYPLALSTWARCLDSPGFREELLAFPWRDFCPEVGYQLLELWLLTQGGCWDREPYRHWKVMRRLLRSLAYHLKAVPLDYQVKLVRSLRASGYLWQEAGPPRPGLENLVAVLAYTCRAPFDIKERANAVLESLAERAPALREAFLASPDRSFQALEKACRRGNDADLIEKGFAVLREHAGALCLAAFRRHPRQLAEIAHLLGTLRLDLRPTVVKDVAAEALFNEAETLGREELLAALSDSGFDEDQARARLEKKSRAELLGLLPSAFLRRVHERARQCLSQGLAVSSERPVELHALQVLSSLDGNRRPLRRYLKAWSLGDRGYLLRHPTTQAWLSQHPTLPIKAWVDGIRREYQSPETGALVLAIERDPYEVLRLGTHAGSCLGLGGPLMYSAAANVLDFNKAVVYARNPNGRVVARQLVALSEAETLVCFGVYCSHSRKRFEEHFHSFDKDLAEHLGVALHRGEDYEVAVILADEWWDDHPWEPETGAAGP